MKAMSKTKATARVQITVEVTLDNPWGPDATIADINRKCECEKSAAASVVDAIERLAK